jgi:ATP-dependent exoDNAse (exonuclease V) alpha subunit
MRWLKWLLIGVAALLLLFAAVSLALASQLRIVDRSVAIAAPAGKVLPRVASQAGQHGRTAPDRRGPELRLAATS